MSDEPRTALSSAHERFVRSVPERGRELQELARELQGSPTDERLCEQLSRKLHALHGSAQVFDDASLREAIELVLAGVEAARAERRPPTPSEIDTVLVLAEWLSGGARDAAALITSLRADAGAAFDSMAAERQRASWDEAAPAEAADAQVQLAQSVSGTLPAEDVLAVLVVAGRELELQVRAALPEERCEITTSAEPETALAVIDQVAPDVVLVEGGLLAPRAADLIAELRGGRAAAVRAVVAIVPAGASDIEALLGRTDIDAVLRSPLPARGLFEQLGRLSGRGLPAPSGLVALGTGTVEEIAREVAQEIERGISGSLRQGRAARIDLGDVADLRAATWSAVARVRASLVKRGAGRVRFDDAPFGGGPLALALTGPEPSPPYTAPADALRGRRILVADDDPAVVWFFGNLLRESGAIAIEASDGKQALELARKRPPDVIVSDILMPHIDGFTLCRELRRDLALSHVPVILLSWKEDFLQRMRELDAGAVGYLRKEASSEQILSTIAQALRPCLELVALLSSEGEVQGRIEPLGVPRLLRTVARHRPDARVAVRDAWNLFEVDMRGGSTLAVTRTASDGSFARGPLALRQLLGVDAGRFSVTYADGPARNPFAEPLEALLAEGLRQLGAVLDALCGSRLSQVFRVTLDDEVLRSLLSATPTALAHVASRLRTGAPVRELLLSGWIAASDLEQHLRELARRGAVLSVFGPDGEDLVEAARRAREQQPGSLLHTAEPPSWPPLEVSEHEVQWIDSDRPAQAPRAEPAAAASSAAPPQHGARSFATPAPPASPGAAAARAAADPDPAPFAVRSSLLQGPARPSSPPPLPSAARALQRAGLMVVLAALAVVGFAAVRLLASDVEPPPVKPARPSAPAPELSAAGTRTPTQAAAGRAGPKAAAAAPDRALGFGRALPFIDPQHEVEVARDEGLLVIERAKGGAAPRVKVGGRDLGTAPLAAALPEGRHELVLQRGERTSFRYVIIRRGETRVVELTPESP